MLLLMVSTRGAEALLFLLLDKELWDFLLKTRFIAIVEISRHCLFCIAYSSAYRILELCYIEISIVP